MIKLVNNTIDKTAIDRLTSWLEGDPKLTKGELTVQLEEKWSKILGVKHSVYVNSGSSAILLTLATLKFTDRLKNNKVVTSNLSWATDVSSPILLGMDTILVDCNLYDLSVNLVKLEKIFKEESPAVFILVSVLGLVPDMTLVTKLCEAYGVILLEDACESMGSKFNNQNLGTFGLASFFSLYYGHHLSTIEGGFISTDDEDLYNGLISMRSHGWDRDLSPETQSQWRSQQSFDDFSALYKFYLPGFNVRATDLQAFIGLDQLDKLEKYIEARSSNYLLYKNFIKVNELKLFYSLGDVVSNFAYPVLNKNRDSIVKNLRKYDIEVRPLIAGAISTNPFAKKYARWDDNMKNSLLLDKYGFYVPNHPELSVSDIKIISEIINLE